MALPKTIETINGVSCLKWKSHSLKIPLKPKYQQPKWIIILPIEHPQWTWLHWLLINISIDLCLQTKLLRLKCFPLGILTLDQLTTFALFRAVSTKPVATTMKLIDLIQFFFRLFSNNFSFKAKPSTQATNSWKTFWLEESRFYAFSKLFGISSRHHNKNSKHNCLSKKFQNNIKTEHKWNISISRREKKQRKHKISSDLKS